MYCYGKKVSADELRRVRVALGENQTQFAARFGRVRRTVIRWEQSGACLQTWARHNMPSEEEIWTAALAELDARGQVEKSGAGRFIVSWLDDRGEHSHQVAELEALDLAAELVSLTGARAVCVRPDLLTAAGV